MAENKSAQLTVKPNTNEAVPVQNTVVFTASCTCGEDEFVFRILSGPATQYGSPSATTYTIWSQTPGEAVVEAADNNGHIGTAKAAWFSFPTNDPNNPR